MMIKNRSQFVELINNFNYRVGAEIGVQAGYFSQHLLTSKIEKLYLIDCWTFQDNYFDIANVNQIHQNNLYELVKNKFAKNDRVKIIKKFSIDASEDFNHEYFDFIYLDADHKHNAIKNDIKVWYKRLKKGGMLAGHDYLDGIHNNCEFGVKKAVDEFVEKNDKKLYVTNEDAPWSSWYFIK